jgi:hypothetical protein
MLHPHHMLYPLGKASSYLQYNNIHSSIECTTRRLKSYNYFLSRLSKKPFLKLHCMYQECRLCSLIAPLHLVLNRLDMIYNSLMLKSMSTNQQHMQCTAQTLYLESKNLLGRMNTPVSRQHSTFLQSKDHKSSHPPN